MSSAESLFTEFFEFCASVLVGENPKILDLIQHRYDDCQDGFRNSQELVRLFTETTRKMAEDKSRLFIHLKELADVLKANRKSKKKSGSEKKRKRHQQRDAGTEKGRPEACSNLEMAGESGTSRILCTGQEDESCEKTDAKRRKIRSCALGDGHIKEAKIIRTSREREAVKLNRCAEPSASGDDLSLGFPSSFKTHSLLSLSKDTAASSLSYRDCDSVLLGETEFFVRESSRTNSPLDSKRYSASSNSKDIDSALSGKTSSMEATPSPDSESIDSRCIISPKHVQSPRSVTVVTINDSDAIICSSPVKNDKSSPGKRPHSKVKLSGWKDGKVRKELFMSKKNDSNSESPHSVSGDESDDVVICTSDLSAESRPDDAPHSKDKQPTPIVVPNHDGPEKGCDSENESQMVAEKKKSPEQHCEKNVNEIVNPENPNCVVIVGDGLVDIAVQKSSEDGNGNNLTDGKTEISAVDVEEKMDSDEADVSSVVDKSECSNTVIASQCEEGSENIDSKSLESASTELCRAVVESGPKSNIPEIENNFDDSNDCDAPGEEEPQSVVNDDDNDGNDSDVVAQPSEKDNNEMRVREETGNPKILSDIGNEITSSTLASITPSSDGRLCLNKISNSSCLAADNLNSDGTTANENCTNEEEDLVEEQPNTDHADNVVLSNTDQGQSAHDAELTSKKIYENESQPTNANRSNDISCPVDVLIDSDSDSNELHSNQKETVDNGDEKRAYDSKNTTDSSQSIGAKTLNKDSDTRAVDSVSENIVSDKEKDHAKHKNTNEKDKERRRVPLVSLDDVCRGSKMSFLGTLSLGSKKDCDSEAVHAKTKGSEASSTSAFSAHKGTKDRERAMTSSAYKGTDDAGENSADEFTSARTESFQRVVEDAKAKGKKPPSERHIKKLENLLEKLRDEIEKGRELTLEEMDQEDSFYVYEDKLKKKFVAAWTKLCEITDRTVTTGRPTERSIHYNGTRYKEINRRLEKFLNKRKQFPDFQDVKTIIKMTNTKCNLHLSAQMMNDLAREAFVDIGEMLQTRRHQDFIASFGSRQTDNYSEYCDPAFSDPDLRRKLEKNRKLGRSNLEAVITKYTELQYTRGTAKEDSNDDDDEDDDGSEDDEGEKTSRRSKKAKHKRNGKKERKKEKHKKRRISSSSNDDEEEEKEDGGQMSPTRVEDGLDNLAGNERNLGQEEEKEKMDSSPSPTTVSRVDAEPRPDNAESHPDNEEPRRGPNIKYTKRKSYPSISDAIDVDDNDESESNSPAPPNDFDSEMRVPAPRMNRSNISMVSNPESEDETSESDDDKENGGDDIDNAKDNDKDDDDDLDVLIVSSDANSDEDDDDDDDDRSSKCPSPASVISLGSLSEEDDNVDTKPQGLNQKERQTQHSEMEKMFSVEKFVIEDVRSESDSPSSSSRNPFSMTGIGEGSTTVDAGPRFSGNLSNDDDIEAEGQEVKEPEMTSTPIKKKVTDSVVDDVIVILDTPEKKSSSDVDKTPEKKKSSSDVVGNEDGGIGKAVGKKGGGLEGDGTRCMLGNGEAGMAGGRTTGGEKLNGDGDDVYDIDDDVVVCGETNLAEKGGRDDDDVAVCGEKNLVEKDGKDDNDVADDDDVVVCGETSLAEKAGKYIMDDGKKNLAQKDGKDDNDVADDDDVVVVVCGETSLTDKGEKLDGDNTVCGEKNLVEKYGKDDNAVADDDNDVVVCGETSLVESSGKNDDDAVFGVKNLMEKDGKDDDVVCGETSLAESNEDDAVKNLIEQDRKDNDVAADDDDDVVYCGEKSFVDKDGKNSDVDELRKDCGEEDINIAEKDEMVHKDGEECGVKEGGEMDRESVVERKEGGSEDVGSREMEGDDENEKKKSCEEVDDLEGSGSDVVIETGSCGKGGLVEECMKGVGVEQDGEEEEEDGKKKKEEDGKDIWIVRRNDDDGKEDGSDNEECGELVVIGRKDLQSGMEGLGDEVVGMKGEKGKGGGGKERRMNEEKELNCGKDKAPEEEVIDLDAENTSEKDCGKDASGHEVVIESDSENKSKSVREGEKDETECTVVNDKCTEVKSDEVVEVEGDKSSLLSDIGLGVGTVKNCHKHKDDGHCDQEGVGNSEDWKVDGSQDFEVYVDRMDDEEEEEEEDVFNSIAKLCNSIIKSSDEEKDADKSKDSDRGGDDEGLVWSQIAGHWGAKGGGGVRIFVTNEGERIEKVPELENDITKDGLKRKEIKGEHVVDEFTQEALKIGEFIEENKKLKQRRDSTSSSHSEKVVRCVRSKEDDRKLVESLMKDASVRKNRKRRKIENDEVSSDDDSICSVSRSKRMKEDRETDSDLEILKEEEVELLPKSMKKVRVRLERMSETDILLMMKKIKREKEDTDNDDSDDVSILPPLSPSPTFPRVLEESSARKSKPGRTVDESTAFTDSPPPPSSGINARAAVVTNTNSKMLRLGPKPNITSISSSSSLYTRNPPTRRPPIQPNQAGPSVVSGESRHQKTPAPKAKGVNWDLIYASLPPVRSQDGPQVINPSSNTPCPSLPSSSMSAGAVRVPIPKKGPLSLQHQQQPYPRKSPCVVYPNLTPKNYGNVGSGSRRVITTTTRNSSVMQVLPKGVRILPNQQHNNHHQQQQAQPLPPAKRARLLNNTQVGGSKQFPPYPHPHHHHQSSSTTKQNQTRYGSYNNNNNTHHHSRSPPSATTTIGIGTNSYPARNTNRHNRHFNNGPSHRPTPRPSNVRPGQNPMLSLGPRVPIPQIQNNPSFSKVISTTRQRQTYAPYNSQHIPPSSSLTLSSSSSSSSPSSSRHSRQTFTAFNNTNNNNIRHGNRHQTTRTSPSISHTAVSSPHFGNRHQTQKAAAVSPVNSRRNQPPTRPSTHQRAQQRNAFVAAQQKKMDGLVMVLDDSDDENNDGDKDKTNNFPPAGRQDNNQTSGEATTKATTSKSSSSSPSSIIPHQNSTTIASPSPSPSTSTPNSPRLSSSSSPKPVASHSPSSANSPTVGNNSNSNSPRSSSSLLAPPLSSPIKSGGQSSTMAGNGPSDKPAASNSMIVLSDSE